MLHWFSLMPEPKPRRFARAVALAAAALGFAAVVLATRRYGPGVSHDSVAYLHASSSLLAGNGFEYFGYRGTPYIQWPPLFPALLAAAGCLGADPVAASRWLNAAAFAAIAGYGGLLLGSSLKHRTCVVAGISLLLFAAPLIEISQYVWTETIFVLLLLASFDAYQRFGRERRTALLAWAAVFAALAWLDRYLGITLVITEAVLLALDKRRLAERLRNVVLYGAIASAPMLIWMGRNYLVSGTLAGVRVPSAFSLSENLKLTAAAFATWLPAGSRAWLGAVTVLVPAITVGAVLVLSVFKRWKSPDPRLATMIFMGVFIMVYLLYLIGSATWVAIESINSRFMDPLYAPAVFVFIAAADMLLSVLAGPPGVFYRVALTLTVGVSVFTAFSAIQASGERGAGAYSTTDWRNNVLARVLQARPPDPCTYYSNAPDAVYALTGIHAYWPPKKAGPPMYGIDAFRKHVERDACTYIVWFGSGPGGGLYGIEDLEKLFRLDPVERNSAGAIYRITGR